MKKSNKTSKINNANVYSQTGEDGVIDKILQILPHKDKWAVDCGAGDGVLWSNTRNLLVNKQYSAVLVEKDKSKFERLQMNCAQYPKVIALNQLVGFDETNSLDRILRDTSIPIDFDFLSIDIDGNDYHVWDSLTIYKPKVVCIEFNQTIPTEVSFVQPRDLTVNQGSSLLSLTTLGKKKGYELVAVLPVNAIYVKAKYYPLFHLKDNNPMVLRTYLNDVTYLFVGYDGTIFLRGHNTLHWHGIELTAFPFQRLPKFLRSFPDNYNAIQRKLFHMYLALLQPRVYFKRKLHDLSRKIRA